MTNTIHSRVFAVAIAIFSMQAHAQYAAADSVSGSKTAPPASSITKSLDSTGRVVYSDHGIDGTREVKVLRGRTFTDAPKAATVAPVTPGDSIVDWAKNAQLQLDSSRKSVKDANERMGKENCQNAKQSLASLSANGRIVRMSPENKPETLTSDQIEADKKKAKDAIAQYCR